ncbi:nucleotide exchange factor GrpE [Patescibacteria group bacterium]|nr:nucleotide exchange factor GrpE [Patescibacteria group bacterium]
MTEEQEKKQLKRAEKDPSVVVGVFVFNKKGEILFFSAPKWGNAYSLPGGHIDVGETINETVIREVKEETGLDIINVEFVSVIEFINDKRFVNGIRHIVGLNHKAELKDENQSVILNEEGTEYVWLKPEDAIKNERVLLENKEIIKEFFIKKKKKGFSKKCKNCEKTDEYKSGWARAQADYQNLVKETEKNRSEWAQYSERQILEEFIPVYDNFRLATNLTNFETNNTNNETNASFENWKKGIECIMKQFGDVLKQHGIEDIETVGQEFNPELHEAVDEEESEEIESGKILKQVSAGYRMNGKVIRVAKVVVSK